MVQHYRYPDITSSAIFLGQELKEDMGESILSHILPESDIVTAGGGNLSPSQSGNLDHFFVSSMWSKRLQTKCPLEPGE